MRRYSANTVAPERTRPRTGEADLDVARRGVATFNGEYPPGGLRRGLQEFVRRYGWRAYALPILAVVTAAALLTTNTTAAARPDAAGHGSGAGHTSQGPPVASDHTTLKPDAPGNNAHLTALNAAALPSGPAYPLNGTGTYRVLPGTGKAVGSGHLFRYSIEVENGITGINVTQFATLVETTLSDPRSWSGHGVSLQRVDSGPVDFHVTLTSAMTVRKLCGYDIPVETSCYIGAGATSPVNRVVMNDARWVRGAAAYVGDLNAYRIYMINHEDGHAIGHEHAHECLPGGLAPTMMQQTIGLTDPNTHKLCEANPWPYPPGVSGAPGAEQPDTTQNSEFGINGD
jgi:hypothetical protein